jgi:outer membrane lipoprotein SlyB
MIRPRQPKQPKSPTPPNPWENFDRTAIMTAGGAFLGAAIVQHLGGGPTQLLGAFLGAILGLLSGLYVSR